MNMRLKANVRILFILLEYTNFGSLTVKSSSIYIMYYNMNHFSSHVERLFFIKISS